MGGKDLAGLAALGTLGYMLANRKNKEEGPAMDTGAFEGMKNLSRVDTGMSEKEPGAGATDYGSEKEPGWDTKPSASSMSSVKKVVRNPNSGMTNAPSKYKEDSPAVDAIRNKVNSGAMDTGGFEGMTPKKSGPKVGRAGQASGASSDTSFQDKMAMEYLQNKRDKESGKDTSFFGGSQRSRPYLKDNMKAGGKVVKMAKGGMTSSASSRGDGIAQRGKTKGTMIMCGGGYAKGKK